MPDSDAAEDHLQEAPSKSELKRRMSALQELGESLTRLGDKQLAQVPIEDEQLLLAIREARKIRSNSARRRHLQFIGKLMRNIDPSPIEQALQAMRNRQQQNNDAFHELERLRDELLSSGMTGIDLAIARWPQADRQQLRQLILQHQRETQRHKPPTASRKLFRYLRELQENYG